MTTFASDQSSSRRPSVWAAAHPNYPLSLGAFYSEVERQCRFRVWAPKVESVDLCLVDESSPTYVEMTARPNGYFEATISDVGPGIRYQYRLDNDREFPDPASRYQPEGVHGPSEVVDPQFDWQDGGWNGIPLHEYITYELHVGTFTPEGTFDAMIPYLDELKELGVTAVELMPVAQFPGSRNWGYDGAYLYAVHNSYGGPAGLKRLVDACHQRGLAVVLDVVYNHLGPEGSYLGEFGHYFTERHRTPWGASLNFDDRDSDEVRRFFIENALHWIDEFHIDALRLDAIHAIFDQTARPFLLELAEAVRQQGEISNRQVFTIAESNLNDVRLTRPIELGGLGLDSQWSDDFHHSLHTMLTGERGGYYEDFQGFEDFVKSYREGFVFVGQHSNYRGRRHGSSGRSLPATRFVVCAQNHDQVGNRMLGERLSQLVEYEDLKLAAGAVLLSPYLPLLFMGEEYGETAPFQYFVSHSDPDLVEAVRKGRREEFASFGWKGEPPDAQAEATFEQCKLNHELRRSGRHRLLWTYYQRLIELRKTIRPLAFLERDQMDVTTVDGTSVMAVHRWTTLDEVIVCLNCGTESARASVGASEGGWNLELDSADTIWGGPGSYLSDPLQSSNGHLEVALAPRSVVVLSRQS